MSLYNKRSVGDLLLLDIMADMHCLDRKLSYFVRKYKTDLEHFEALLTSRDESFEHYDDLIEWKAYQSEYDALAREIEEIKHGSFQIA
jgi:hypothetical protein